MNASIACLRGSSIINDHKDVEVFKYNFLADRVAL